MPTTEDAIKQAERTHADLAKRLETLRADRAANEERRAALAFEAETGDAAAKRSIAELTKVAAALDVDVQTVEAAIAEAARRVRAAAEASSRQAERDKAEKGARGFGAPSGARRRVGSRAESGSRGISSLPR